MMTGTDNLLNFAGVMGLAAWLLKTSLGRTALIHAPTRRISMSPFMILPALLLWQGPPAIIVALAAPILNRLPEWISWSARNLVMSVGAIGAAVGYCVLAWHTFARRIWGLGLGLKHLRRDIVQALVILFCIMPVVLVMIVAVQFLGEHVNGPDYDVGQHQELEVLASYPQMWLKLSVAVVAVLAAPLVEELLFRGLIQTLIRSYIGRPWLSVILTSVLFATVHENYAHWPALFVLSLGMGYAYEKSGSLWQPLFMHAMFNGMSVMAFM
ncbi:MAG: CPBP family intramembrane metalloprotease [Planctomycetes bacterium]|nr:CPBP family intramembrane metalloprotease [Planctomycetota bacterium]